MRKKCLIVSFQEIITSVKQKKMRIYKYKPPKNDFSRIIGVKKKCFHVNSLKEYRIMNFKIIT